MSKDESTGVVVVGCTTMIFMVVAGVLARGLVLSYLWYWFIVPFGLPPIHTAWALGVSLVVGSLSKEGTPKDEKERDLSDTVLYFSGVCLGQPLLVLLMGWLIHFWM